MSVLVHPAAEPDVRIRVITRDLAAEWLDAIDGRDRHVEIGAAADADAIDLVVHDRDAFPEVASLGGHLPVIVVASRFRAGEVNDLLRAGAAACVTKSDVEQLDAVCVREIDRSRQRVNTGSDHWFRILSQAAFDGVLLHERGRIRWVNERCAAMMGYEPQRMVRMSVFELTHPDFHETVRRHMEHDSAARFESVALRADGTPLPIEVCGVTDDETGLRIVALKDLSDRKQAEALMAESRRLGKELFQSRHALLCQHDLDGNVLAVNIGSALALGIPAHELRTMNLRQIIDPSTASLFEDYLQALQRDGSAEGLMTVRTRSGERRIWHYQNTIVTRGVDRPIVRGLARDVTEREDALHALRASERHFRSLIENTSDLIAILDREGLLEYHSPSAERLLGFPGTEIEGLPLADLIHRDDLVEASALFAVDPNAPPSATVPDIRLRHRDGSWRWFSFVVRRVRTGQTVKSIILNGRDVTDRRRLVAQLEQAERLTSLGRLAATVAHEFNNVLMGMQPFAELLQRPSVSPEAVATGARHIANSITRGKNVALDILRFTQPAEPAIRPFELREWWDRFSPEMRATTRTSVEFDVSIPRGLTILGDSSQLAQLVGNLINNARDAMPRGGILRIAARVPAPDETFAFGVVRSPERFAQISVADTGVGMPPHVREHAFDPLFTTKQNGGTGLGLAVAHQIVTRHGGSIFVESEVEVGTAFHIFLPIADAVTHDVEPEPEAAHIRARRILLVEDERDIATGLAELLADLDVQTVIAPTGRSAQEAARQFDPDVVLLDIGLPDIDGFEVARLLRAEWPDLNIVFISGHGDARRVPSVGPNMAFLQKPFSIETMLATIAELESRSEPS